MASKTEGIQPYPQRLSKAQADAVVAAAELVADPEHRDAHQWIVRSGTTVIGYVVPSYGGTSRSGRNGWVGRLNGMDGPGVGLGRRPRWICSAAGCAW